MAREGAGSPAGAAAAGASGAFLAVAGACMELVGGAPETAAKNAFCPASDGAAGAAARGANRSASIMRGGIAVMIAGLTEPVQKGLTRPRDHRAQLVEIALVGDGPAVLGHEAAVR